MAVNMRRNGYNTGNGPGFCALQIFKSFAFYCIFVFNKQKENAQCSAPLG